jgi:hypothetical protein
MCNRLFKEEETLLSKISPRPEMALIWESGPSNKESAHPLPPGPAIRGLATIVRSNDSVLFAPHGVNEMNLGEVTGRFQFASGQELKNGTGCHQANLSRWC